MGQGRAVLSLASILSFRMLGLFLIYPVFAIYAASYHDANATLMGIALGIYGLSQALLQLPLSMLSDRIGRKPVIYAGLIIFALGSFLSAIANNIYLLILGRGLQGAGAIGSTLMAFCADLTPIKNRTKAMAVLGMTIGLSFGFAMIFGPILNSLFHLTGIFWLTGILAILGLVILYSLPTEVGSSAYQSNQSQLVALKQLLFNKRLLTLNISILLTHAILTATFSVVPLLFSQANIPGSCQWKIYMPVLLAAFLLTIPLLVISERKHLVSQLIIFSVLLMGIAAFTFYYFSPTQHTIMVALYLFFTGFSSLEALLPSLISKIAPTEHKGSAMGIFSTFQFLGIFLGGLSAGLLRTYHENAYIFYITTCLCSVWIIFLLLSFSNQKVTAPASSAR